MQIIQKPCASVNFRAGRKGHEVEAVIIHIIDGSQAGCDATFASSSLELKRSAHYSVGRGGRVHQYVDEHDTAFHAGRVQPPQPLWKGLKTLPGGGFVNPNLYTIGIEHEGRADDDWLDIMYQTTAQLMIVIAARHPKIGQYSEKNVGLHRQIFSGKRCPGNKFVLQKLLNTIASPPPVVVTPAVVAATTVTVETPVRVRKGSASTSAPIHSILAVGRQVAPLRETNGETVRGNPRWYELTDGFIWAGATDHP